VSLHDALIDTVVVDNDQSGLTLVLIVGDLQHGYERAELRYQGVQMSENAVEMLEAAAREPETELVADELDRAIECSFEHRLLFWPYREVKIAFESVAVRRTALSRREASPNTSCRFTRHNTAF
jgi:hypothetical protein